MKSAKMLVSLTSYVCLSFHKNILIPQFKGLATKDDLTTQTKELQKFAEEQTDLLARIIATTVAEPMEKHFQKIAKELDVYEEVKGLKADMERIKEALHLSPSGT